MINHQNVPLPNGMVGEIDSRRGLIKRATYVQALILAAWKNQIAIAPAVPASKQATAGIANTPVQEMLA